MAFGSYILVYRVPQKWQLSWWKSHLVVLRDINTCHRIQELLLFKIERINHRHAKYKLRVFSCIFMCNTSTSAKIFLPLRFLLFILWRLYIKFPCNAGNAAKCFPEKNTRVIKVWKKSGEQIRCQHICMKPGISYVKQKLKLLWGDKKATFQLGLLVGNLGCWVHPTI